MNRVVGQKRAWLRALTIVVAMVTFAVACSGGSADTPVATTDTDTAQRTPVATRTPVASPAAAAADARLPAIAVAAPELRGLGELAAVHAAPVRQTFDANGGSMTFADGSTLQVPSQAFQQPTEVSVVLVDLLFGLYLESAPASRVYRLETTQDVDLMRPVILEIPKAGASQTALNFVDGRWVEQMVPDLPTTRIEIANFSTRMFAITDRPDCNLPVNASLCPNGPASVGVVWQPIQVLTIIAEYLQGPNAGQPIRGLTGAACATLCPTRGGAAGSGAPERTSPGASSSGSSGSTDSTGSRGSGSTASTGSTPAPAAATPVPTQPASGGGATQTPTAVPPPLPTATVQAITCESGYTPQSGQCVTPKLGCVFPQIELERSGQSPGCVSEASCIAIGSGWTYGGGKCIPPKCESGYSEFNGKCVSVELKCPYPFVEFYARNLSGECISHTDCVSWGTGWGHQLGICDGPPVQTCQFGYAWDGFDCVTPNLFCAYPLIEFFGQGQQPICVTESDCIGFGTGWYPFDGQCLFDG